MVTVLPGTELTLARFFLLNSLFSRELLPTLDLPAKVISGLSDGGSCCEIPNDLSNSALLKFIAVTVLRLLVYPYYFL